MQSPFANLTPVVKNLIIINLLFFAATYALGQFVDLNRLLDVFYPPSPYFKPWQVITYMFMHGSFAHIFFNMLALFMFGPILEQTLGSKKFFNYYFITGIGGFVLYMAMNAIQVYHIAGMISIPNPQLIESYSQYAHTQEQAQKLYDIYHYPMLGASGAVFGILVGFGMLYPNMEMMIMFIPVPVKAKYVVLGYIALELFSGVRQVAGDDVAHYAHLGGAMFGFIMIKLWGLKSTNNYY